MSLETEQCNLYHGEILTKPIIHSPSKILQIYFRIHVSVLKLLFDKFPDVDVGVLEDHLQRASKGPFYHAEFDTDIGPGNVYRTESTTSGLCHAPAKFETKFWKELFEPGSIECEYLLAVKFELALLLLRENRFCIK